MSTFPVNDIVPVTLRVSALPQQAANFSIALVLSSVQAKPSGWATGQRTASYTSEILLADDFPYDTALQNFAAVFFGQSPQPASLKVGLWLTGDASATAAIAACLNYDPAFYLTACEPGTSASDVKLVAAFCQSNGLRFFFNTQESDVLSPATPPTNLLAFLSGTAGVVGGVSTPRAMGIYTSAASDANNCGAAALMAIAATMNIGQPNSMSTFMFKQLALQNKPSLTGTELARIVGTFDGATAGWNGNAYVTMGTTDMLVRGQACDGRFEDEGLALDWLVAGVQTSLFNCLQQAVTAGSRIPQTDEGSARLCQSLEPFMSQVRSTGLCAPGVWNFDGVGNKNKGDTLEKGYYVFPQPVSSLTDAQRAARQAPAITILVCGAGAIQYCAPTIIFQR